MSKFECLMCSYKITTEEEAKFHNEIFQDHFIIEIKWKQRLCRWLTNLDFLYILSVSAASVINGLILSHSDFSHLEGLIESLCMGIVLARILDK